VHLGRTGGGTLFPVNSSPTDLCQIREGTPVIIHGFSTAWSNIEDPLSTDMLATTAGVLGQAKPSEDVAG
jgi:hypothetical protein